MHKNYHSVILYCISMIYEVLDFLKKYIDISLVLILNYILLSAFYNKKEVIDYLLFFLYILDIQKRRPSGKD